VTSTKAVRHTFKTVNDHTSLGVFVKFAIEGVGDALAFGGDRLATATEARGREAARELLAHLKELHKTAGLETVDEFVVGYVPKSPIPQDDLASWDALQAEAFAIMMSDSRADPYEIGKRLIAVIRKCSDFASPRLAAWVSRPNEPTSLNPKDSAEARAAMVSLLAVSLAVAAAAWLELQSWPGFLP